MEREFYSNRCQAKRSARDTASRWLHGLNAQRINAQIQSQNAVLGDIIDYRDTQASDGEALHPILYEIRQDAEYVKPAYCITRIRCNLRERVRRYILQVRIAFTRIRYFTHILGVT